MTVFLIILGCLVFLLVLFFLATYIPYRMTFYRHPKKRWINPKSGLEKDGYRQFAEISEKMIDDIVARPYEEIFITSYDGLRLRGRYYHVRDGAPLAIQCHGYKSSPMRDFAGGGVMVMQMGFNVIMIEQRAHEGSEGRALTFGGKERYDCRSWVDYARERFGEDVKIMLYGLSMGAATVLMASELDLTDSVKGIVADCPYSSTEAIIKNTIRDMRLPAGLLYPLVRLGGILYAGFDAGRVVPAEAVKGHRVPILLIHGECDSFVPCCMSAEIFEGIKDDELCSRHTFPNAEHGISFLHDTERYERLVRDFSLALGVIDE